MPSSKPHHDDPNTLACLTSLPISFDYYSHHNFVWVKFCLAFSHMHFLLDIEIAFQGDGVSSRVLSCFPARPFSQPRKRATVGCAMVARAMSCAKLSSPRGRK